MYELALVDESPGVYPRITLEDGEARELGRGETTNIYDSNVSRRHCRVVIAGDRVEIEALGVNSLIISPGGDTMLAKRLKRGEKTVVKVGDTLSLLPNGAYTYKVSITKVPVFTDEARAPTPPREDTDDDEPPPDGSLSPVTSFSYKRVSVEKVPQDEWLKGYKMPWDDDDDDTAALAPAPGPPPPPAAVADEDPAAATAADDLAPPAKKAKLVCKYGEACFRKNPDHIRMYHTDSTTSTKEAPAASSSRPVCKYGAACVRKNPLHFKEFAHPTDTPPKATDLPSAPAPPPTDDLSDIDVTDLSLRKTRAIDGEIPLKYMPEDELVMVDSSHGNYKMKYTAGTYYCTCVAWRYQNKGPDARTCKHLKEYLGEAFERVRCGISGGGAAKPATAKKFPMSGVLLAEKWDERKDPTGWWMSEKLDGVRAYWDGTRFLSRNGNEFTAPDFFTSGLPSEHLDGELFGGRGKFQATVGVVKSASSHKGWADLTYEIFDMPQLKAPWEERLKEMNRRFAASANKHHHLVDQIQCKGHKHVTEELDRIEALKGEGVMLRQPGSFYVTSRSSTLLKVKRFKDTEAIVRAYDKGKGKNTDRMGALVCELPNGKQFNVGTGFTDKQRLSPPKIGAVITVKYQELTVGGVPRFPVFLGERADAVWPPK